MTISSTANKVSYAGTGGTGPFPVPFRFLTNNDLMVVRTSAAGIETELALGLDYTASGADLDGGGAVATTAPVAIGERLTILPNHALTQLAKYVPNDPFPAKVHERALDRLTLIAQQIAEKLSRAVLFPVSETVGGTIGTVAQRAGKFLGFDRVTGELRAIGTADFKGDPGGNTMAIGMFSVAATLNIPNGTDLVQTSGFAARGVGQARYVYDPAVDANFVLNYPRMAFLSANGRGFRLAETDINVRMFGAKGDGVTDDWPALNEIAIYMFYYSSIRSLRFPLGTYCISKTLDFSLPIQCAQFIGATGYDGMRGPLNFTMFTCLKWIGAADPNKPMVKFDRTSGLLWRGISLNCDYKAGYGLQLMSSTPADGSVKNLVENMSVHYATRDGVIVGTEGVPNAPPAGRQFFGTVFRNMTAYGCQRSMFHINEWNADQLMFDCCMCYHDDNPIEANRVLCDNQFWFDHGGQWSVILNCQVGGMDVQAGKPWSGYMIRNAGSDNGQSGAFGLCVINAWQEGAGGLYYGVTSTNDSKGNLFQHCASFTSNPANYSVRIDKGTSDPITHTFVGCTFLSDIKVDTPALRKRELVLQGNTFAAGKGVLDPDGRKIIDGLYTSFDTTGGSMVIPRLVDSLFQVLTTNIAIVYAESVSKVGDIITVVLTQDATGGRTVDWGASGNFSLLPAIPAPATEPGAKTVYRFFSDGTKYYLT